MPKINNEDLDILQDALLDAIEYSRENQDKEEYQNKKELYLQLYNKIFL